MRNSVKPLESEFTWFKIQSIRILKVAVEKHLFSPCSQLDCYLK